jgi:hypothetical protein
MQEKPMVDEILIFEEVKDTPLKKIIDRVLNEHTRFIIQISDHDSILIQSQPPLKPLPVFEGRVPENWKEAVYEID